MSQAVVSLFSGAGGMSLGFSRAGLEPAFAADIDPHACATYAANLAVEAHALDLADADAARLQTLLEPHRGCLAVIGGPPCQGFSTAGARRGDDPRNRLVFRYLQIVDLIQPTWFLFENVEGILTSNRGESIRDLVKCFVERGYTVRLEKVNFAHYGVPQSRKRVLIMGNRVGIPFHFPSRTHSFAAGKHKSLTLLPMGTSFADAVGDLPPVRAELGFAPYDAEPKTDFAKRMRAGNSSRGVRLHFATTSPQDAARFARLESGQTMKDLPEALWHPSFRARAFRRVADGTPTEKRGGAPAGIKRLFWDQGAGTVTGAATREFIHPIEDRQITLQEAARLQTFPDWFSFRGAATAIARQIGNAVPPDGAELFARRLMSLDGKAGASGLGPAVGPGLLGFKLTDASGMSPALQNTERLLGALPSPKPTRTFAYAS